MTGVPIIKTKDGVHELPCGQCGTVKYHFHNLDEYAWKLKVRKKNGFEIVYFCSYTCMRKYEKENKSRLVDGYKER